MTTAYRRKMQLHELAARDDATRKIADGVSQWHMRDCRDVKPPNWHTEGQTLCAMALAFLAGCGLTVFVLVLLNAEG